MFIQWLKTTLFTLDNQSGRWHHFSKNISCHTSVPSFILWRHISYHQSTTWRYNSFVREKIGTLLQPRDFRFWVSFRLTLKRGCTGFVYDHGRRRCHNWRSWDRFAWITFRSLGTLRARRSLNSLGALISFSSMGSRRSGRSVFTWRASETWPASSSPDALGALNSAGLGTQGKSYFSSDDVTIDGLTGIWMCACRFRLPFVTKEWLCNNKERKSSTKFKSKLIDKLV